MKETPILCAPEMALAIWEYRKTQTRRIAKLTKKGMLCLRGNYATPIKNGVVMWTPVGGQGELPMPPSKLSECCSFGGVGDRLWVRESFCWWDRDRKEPGDGGSIWYRADPREVGEKDLKWTPSIHMPRWASRMTLEITGVKVERLQDISEEDARAEGVILTRGKTEPGYDTEGRWQFHLLWESINGAGSFAVNPWVWCVSFARVQP